MQYSIADGARAYKIPTETEADNTKPILALNNGGVKHDAPEFTGMRTRLRLAQYSL